MTKTEKMNAFFLLPDGSPFMATIELRDRDGFTQLSIVGKHAHGSGQSTDALRKCKDRDARKLCEIWDRWHLNDMRAGTPAQMAALQDFKHDNVGGWHQAAKAFLAERGLEPDGGYEYGSAWLNEELPASVIKCLRAICKRHAKVTIEGEDEVSQRWNALIDTHDEGVVAAVRAHLGGEVVGESEHGEDVWIGGDIDQAESMFEEYRGEWSSFRDYAEEFADDIGAINKESTWPNNHIDWDAAAKELEHDYTVIEGGRGVYVFLDT